MRKVNVSLMVLVLFVGLVYAGFGECPEGTRESFTETESVMEYYPSGNLLYFNEITSTTYENKLCADGEAVCDDHAGGVILESCV
jgi:hypothetical protein